MDKFTKEQQVQAVYDLKVGYTLGHADIAMLKSMARQLLASMEQETVAYMHHSGQVVTRGECCDDKIFAICCKVETPLYTTPPAPGVHDRYIFEKWWESQNGTPLDGWYSLRTTDGYCDDGIDGQFDAWNACRAAMLQAGNSPVIPNGWKLVPIDPTKDMLRAGQSVVGFWLNTVHCYSKMLAAAPAAPQQEVKSALEHGMQRYAGAMQKLSEGDK